MKKRISKALSILLIFLMMFSLAACGKKDNKDSKTTTEKETESTTEKETESEKETQSLPSGDVPTEITVNLHYFREDNEYTGWNVWFWTTGDGAAHQFGTETDENGVVTTATFPAGTASIGFIVRLNEWEQKDYDGDQFIDTSSILAGTVDVYVVSGTEGFKTEFGEDCMKGTGISSASLSEDYKEISLKLTSDYTSDMTFAVATADGTNCEIDTIDAKEGSSSVKLTLKNEADKFIALKVILNGTLAYDITMPDVYTTSSFIKDYTYDGKDLGATWTKEATTFKVWAPVATKASVNLYEKGEKKADDLIKTVEMTQSDKGVWEVKIDEDLNGTYYTFTVVNNGVETEACDPYAKTVGVNGDRAMVIDMESTNPAGWDKDSNPNSDLGITDVNVYELHVRDLSSNESSGIEHAGKYLGLIEKGTKNANGISTGLDHMLDLGITHLQLNPVYDYATVDETKLDKPQFNWGYDPKNYNAPEGSYSTDPYNGEVRVKEFKEMVKGLHDNGISVVMDVVYNHTYSTDYCFNALVPDYFYRPGANGSGCGNDVATERAMVKKFVVDSVAYWAKEYHIDGFRFDLVGLMDVETMNEIRAAVDEIDPSIILYGEGWDLATKPTIDGTILATQKNVDKLNGIALFNDTIRDKIKGSVFSKTDKGYVNGLLANCYSIANCIKGSAGWNQNPTQLINYASCHDNMTLWDNIKSSNPDDTLEDQIKQNLMSAAIIYTAQGVPFILAGEEMLRSKTNLDGSFNENSYNASDYVNSIKWDELNDEKYQEVYEFYKGMIAFRKAHESFRRTSVEKGVYESVNDVKEGIIAYTLNPSENEVSDGFFVVHNATNESVTVDLPDGEWSICVQGNKAGTESLGTVSGKVTVDSLSSTILVKGKLK